MQDAESKRFNGYYRVLRIDQEQKVADELDFQKSNTDRLVFHEKKSGMTTNYIKSLRW